MIRIAPARLVLSGAIVTTLGLVAAATAPVAGTPGAEQTGARQTAGGVAIVVGWGLLGWGIHRLGREGADGQDGEKARAGGGEGPPP